MESRETASKGGIGFLGILTIVFVIAKLIGAVSWSWWIVFCPLWIPTGAFLAVAILFAIVYSISIAVMAIYNLITKRGDKH